MHRETLSELGVFTWENAVNVQVILWSRYRNHAFRSVAGVTTASGCQGVTGFLQFARLSRDWCYQINPEHAHRSMIV